MPPTTELLFAAAQIWTIHGHDGILSHLMMHCYCLLLATVAALTFFPAARAEVHLPAGFALEVVAGPEFVQEPMDLTFAPDGAAWVTGRAGVSPGERGNALTEGPEESIQHVSPPGPLHELLEQTLADRLAWLGFGSWMELNPQSDQGTTGTAECF